MFVFLAIFAASMIAADEDASPKDLSVRLAVPKIEKCDYRIHVGKEGEWTVQFTQAYSTEGVTSEDADALREISFDQAQDFGMTKMSWSSQIQDHRCQCESSSESDDVLELASLLIRIFEDGRCNFLRWDRESFEWKFLRNEHVTMRDKEESIGEILTNEALEVLFRATLEKIARQKGIARAEWDSTAEDLPKSQLVLTTDGRITADAPAKVSEDGKTMTLDLSTFLSDPPKEWSIRIDGL